MASHAWLMYLRAISSRGIMRKVILLLSILSFVSFADDDFVASDNHEVWQSLDADYVSSLQNGEVQQALNIAFKLNQIDPADTKSLLYIVLASAKSKTKLPRWVMDEPWPNRTKQDVLNRILAEQLVNDREDLMKGFVE